MIQLGARQIESSRQKLRLSPNYNEDQFVNVEETRVMNPDSKSLKVMSEFISKGTNRKPENVIPTRVFNSALFSSENEQIMLSWFGHSTVLFNVDGKTFLTDPFFGHRASPVSFAGTKKFNYSNEHSVYDLPHIDVVLISHDHYDHLDYKTILNLKEKAEKFIVPLGVGAHLRRWKVPEDKIIEMDWQQKVTVDGDITVICTPARHFSGRRLKRNTTLWGSFVVQSKNHSVYFSGDSGYGSHFQKIGEQYGPFDLTLLECGQYNENWPQIHMNPAETLKAHHDLQGRILLPLHWAKFNLSLHSWIEPVETLLNVSNGSEKSILIPEIGEVVRFGDKNEFSQSYWWR
ncbi:MAG: MBL fold metallo-hydrolase [Bacteroidota bacterium]